MKNIVILSGGTGNGAAKRHGTNVRRLYDALDLHRPDQVAYYDDGVGSQEFLPLKLLGGVFGWGLKRNVLEMYAFLCRVYRDADETGEPDRIYLFGFSRGAFTVRVLAGMIAYCGLYGGFADEADLAKVARRNYRAFRSCYRRGYAYQLLRKLAGTTSEPRADTHPDIEFVGVWDTVDAYGLPIDELAILWDLFLYPIRFPDHDLSERVKRACHAVSVDDERLTFHPLLWNEAYPEGQRVRRIEQVWFPGVHSDVGGGYPESELALLSLDWMMTRVEARQPNGPASTSSRTAMPASDAIPIGTASSTTPAPAWRPTTGTARARSRICATTPRQASGSTSRRSTAACSSGSRAARVPTHRRACPSSMRSSPRKARRRCTSPRRAPLSAVSP
jgi:uncharacterized protein (DUF2235 family)